LTGMCFCMLRNIPDVGAEGTVQGGDVELFAPSTRKKCGPLTTFKQNHGWLQAPSGTAGFVQEKILFLLLVISRQLSIQVWR